MNRIVFVFNSNPSDFLCLLSRRTLTISGARDLDQLTAPPPETIHTTDTLSVQPGLGC